MMIAGLFLFGCSQSKKSTGTANAVTAPADVNSALTETYWKLTELMGTPIPANDKDKKEKHLILKKENNIVFGHAGCNSFRGTYTLQEGTFRISFSKMAVTMMACPNMENETVFLEVLGKADNYAIKGNVLSLNKARMAPLAKFEAVLMQ